MFPNNCLKVAQVTFAALSSRNPWISLGIAVFFSCGCSSNALPKKDYDHQAIAEAAIAAFDEDEDGKLGEGEINGCPALRSAMDRIDGNQDGLLSVSEISSRIAAYRTMSEFIIAEVLVRQGQRAISGAEVTLAFPSFMLGGETKFAATTAASGIGLPQSSPERLLGFPPGFYDVQIAHQGKTWEFGVEVADDNPTVSRLEFDLSEE